MDEHFEMDEKIKETLARLVAGLSPESYERLGPGLSGSGFYNARGPRFLTILFGAAFALPASLCPVPMP